MNNLDNNSLDSNRYDNDPDDLLEIEVQPRPLAVSPSQTQQVDSLTPLTPPVPSRAEDPQEAGRTQATPTGGIAGDSHVVESGFWSHEQLPALDEASKVNVADTEEPHWFGLMVREVVETVGLAVIIFLIIRIGIQNYRIEGQSMEPNFHDGEYLIINKLAYRLGEYERGDVIVFKYPNDPSKDYIKRVIGLPGDTVEIRAGQLYVNGNEIEEPYLHMPNVRDEPPTVVDAGHLYVMGDNRPASSDTRSWGQLGQNFVIGQAWLAIYPFEQAGLVEHHPIEVNAVMAQGP